MDKNQLTGIILIMLLMIAYFYFFAPPPPEPAPNLTTTSEQARPQAAFSPKTDADFVRKPLELDTNGILQKASKGNKKLYLLENEDIQISLSSLGASIQKIWLKNYVDYRKEPLILVDSTSLNTLQQIRVKNYGLLDLNNYYYQVEEQPNTLIFKLFDDSDQLTVRRTFTLEPTGFKMAYNCEVFGLDLATARFQITWNQKIKQQEKMSDQLAINTNINYYLKGEGMESLGDGEEQLEGNLTWLAFKQKFFNIGLIAPSDFQNTQIAIKASLEDTIIKVAKLTTNLSLAKPIQFYFGPNDYHICQTITEGYESNVELGWAIFEPISLYLIMPVFEFLEGFLTNYGLIIFVLVIVIKSALFPLTYQSYKSMAKTRVLKPELDMLKEVHGDDTQKIQQEQMKIYSKFGVNPLSGCIPVLAQAPIFLTLFNFFPNAIQLRQKSFLWVEDLSTFDSIATLPFEIPAYGSTVSLFTLLFTASQLAYTYYNNQITPMTAAGPSFMKNIGYIIPLVFLFVFNTFSAGLTYYYFISNLITIGQQLTIRRMVDEKKIRSKLEEYRDKQPTGKGKGKRRWQDRLQKMLQEQQEKQETQRQSKTKQLNSKKDGKRKK